MFFRVVLRRHTGWHIKRVLTVLPKFDDNRPTDGCKKLSYCGDSARRRSLRRSRSFKVTIMLIPVESPYATSY